ncbi:MAG: hypothetical protein AVDCRST_MAG83-2093, partial [uncultured Arthrobacter sp.]
GVYRVGGHRLISPRKGKDTYTEGPPGVGHGPDRQSSRSAFADEVQPDHRIL